MPSPVLSVLEAHLTGRDQVRPPKDDSLASSPVPVPVGHLAGLACLPGTLVQGISHSPSPEASSGETKGFFLSGKPYPDRGTQWGPEEAVLPPFCQQRAVAALRSAASRLAAPVAGNLDQLFLRRRFLRGTPAFRAPSQL